MSQYIFGVTFSVRLVSFILNFSLVNITKAELNMAQPFETFLACVRPKFHSQHVNLDKLLSEKVRYYKTRPTYNNYIIANALFRGDFQRNWNNDFTAQILINTGKWTCTNSWKAKICQIEFTFLFSRNGEVFHSKRWRRRPTENE